MGGGGGIGRRRWWEEDKVSDKSVDHAYKRGLAGSLSDNVS
jgi:hypothetical protein